VSTSEVLSKLKPLDDDGDVGGASTTMVEGVGSSSSGGASSAIAGAQVGDAAMNSVGNSSSGSGSSSGGEARDSEGYSVVAYADGTVAAV
jgi:hypothetical protein